MRRYYAAALLSAGYGVSLLDRQIVGILLEPIKHEFAVPDALLGTLAGPAFALFYATFGIPLAWLADRINRRNLIVVSLAIFSVMTAAGGLAAQFWQLLIARTLTGIGEAGTGPASQSLLSDFFEPAERTWAQSLYAAGAGVGVMTAFFCGGWIAQHHGWRAAFIFAGLPGLVLSGVMFLTLREPRRGGHRALDSTAPPIADAIRFLWSQRAYRSLVLAAAMCAFTSYSVLAFVPSFLARSHGMSSTAIGLALALILGLGGSISSMLAGYCANRWSRTDARWQVWTPAIAAALSLPFWPLFLLAPSTPIALGAAIVPLALTTAWLGPCYAMAQGLAPVRTRAVAASIQLFICNAIGLGLGPLVVGLASDFLRPHFGGDSLRYALMATIASTVLAVALFSLTSKWLIAELKRAR